MRGKGKWTALKTQVCGSQVYLTSGIYFRIQFDYRDYSPMLGFLQCILAITHPNVIRSNLRPLPSRATARFGRPLMNTVRG